MQPPRLATVAKVAAGLLAARLAYRLTKLAYNVLTSRPYFPEVQHSAIPPADWKHAALTEAATREFIAAHFPELQDLADRGNLVVLRPAAMLAQQLAKQQQGGQAGGFMAANASAATADGGPALSQEDVAELLASPVLQSCMAHRVPDLLVLVGTVHVAAESAADVSRVIKAMRPSRVALELCPNRMQALLMDPFADPMWDLQPCPEKLAEQTARKNTSLAQIFEATLKSRDQNVLMALFQGMYARLEDQLKVSVGGEFLAARSALIELLQEARAAPATPEPGQEAAAAALDAQQQERQGPTWLQLCHPADMAVTDTLLNLWASMSPWQRLRLLWELVCVVLWKVDAELVQQLANEDMVDSLLAELQEVMPSAAKPLLHDRNWVLATNSYRMAQHAHGPVVAVVGKGHLPGMVFVVQQLVGWMAKTNGHPLRLVQRGEGGEEEGQQDLDDGEAAVAATAAAAAAMS